MGNNQDCIVCQCCGKIKPYPTKPGLWEYLENPEFNPDGTLVTEHIVYSLITFENYKKVDPPREEKTVCLVKQVWQRVSIVHIDEDLLIIPSGKKRPIWWPDRAIWRKVSDTPNIDCKDVIYEGHRVGDRTFNEDGTIKDLGEFLGKWDKEGDEL